MDNPNFPLQNYHYPVPAAHPEHANWKAVWTCDKWANETDWLAGKAPAETVVVRENLLVSGGINLMLLRLIGDTNLTAFGSGSANIKVGNGTAAAVSGNTDLAGGSTAEAGMDAGYPQITAAQPTTVVFRSTFIAAAGNFAWEEVGVKNNSGGVSDAVRLLNRRVQSFGTKASPAVWTMTLSIGVQ